MGLLFTILAIALVMIGWTAFTGAPYVPSKRAEVRKALRQLYRLDSSDVLVDLGSGDGLVLRIASSLGAKRCIGYEIHPGLVLLARWLSRRDDKVETKLASIWRLNMPKEATVVYVFADSRDIGRIDRLLQSEVDRRSQSIAVISYGFQFDGRVAKRLGAHHLYEFRPLQPDA